MINTERPDAVAGSLLEGQVAILIDGSPFVLIALLLFKFLHSSEDYYQRYDLTTFCGPFALFLLWYPCRFPPYILPSRRLIRR